MKKKNEIELNGDNDVHFSPLETPKSEGNTPSDLGAIKNNNLPNNGSGSRTNRTKPFKDKEINISQTTSPNDRNSNQQVNNFSKGNSLQPMEKIQKEPSTENVTNQALDSKMQNPLLNQNHMKGFGRNKKIGNPKINSSTPFLGKGKGFLPGKGKLPSLQGNKLLSSLTKSPNKKTEVAKDLAKSKINMNLIAAFKALPIHVKLIIVGVAASFVLLFVVIITVVILSNSSMDGNREMLEEYVRGDYTEEQLCHYLKNNGYISQEENCEDTSAFQFFVSLKELVKEYEANYAINRFQVNTELLYESLFYFSADQEAYDQLTKEEIRNLIEASLEEIEESCVIKTYNEKEQTCTKKKYVYTLYEFSLNKYISYLKYGTTSTHPNYGNNKDNAGRNGKSVARICGTGTNTDYIFGYGFVNTSSSPLVENSNCPNDPVTEEDYKKLPITETSLEQLNTYGGVPKYSHIYEGGSVVESPPIGEVVGNGKGADIAAYALQFVGNPYVWGGTSLTNGADCSGFVQKVYEHFGIKLNRHSGDQAKQGKKVACNLDSLKAGDLIFYDNPVSHVALYIGDGKMVHAKGLKYNITIDKYDYSRKGINVCKRMVD